MFPTHGLGRECPQYSDNSGWFETGLWVPRDGSNHHPCGGLKLPSHGEVWASQHSQHPESLNPLLATSSSTPMLLGTDGRPLNRVPCLQTARAPQVLGLSGLLSPTWVLGSGPVSPFQPPSRSPSP